MENIDHIIVNLKQLYDDVNKLKSSNINRDKMFDSKKIKSMTKKIPINGHLLEKADEHTQKLYLRLLCSILQFDNDSDTKESQILFIERIIAGINNKNIIFEEILASSMCMEYDEIDEIINIISKEFAEMFIVDSLICANITGKNNNKISEYLGSIFSLLNIKEEIVKELVYLSLAILELDDERILLTKSIVNINKFIIYMRNPIVGQVGYSLEELKTINNKNAIILNSKFINLKEEINLDEVSCEIISFINCTFDNIHSIVSDTKQVKFINCEFENNVIPIQVETNNSWFKINTTSTVTSNFTFIKLNYGEIINCKFSDCIVSRNLVYLENGNIYDSVFDNCKSELCPSSVSMITLLNGNIKDSKFNKCSSITDKADRGSTMTGVIRIEKGSMSNCTFEECSCYTQSSYGRFANHKPYLVYLINSNINNCNFNNCKSESAYDYDGSYYRCIIALDKSLQKNINFIECNADKNIIEIKE